MHEPERRVCLLREKTISRMSWKNLGAIILLSLLSISVPSFSGLSAQDVPSSSRSREVISRVRPALTTQLAGQGLHFGSPIFIRIFKEEKELEVWVRQGKDFRLFKNYPVCSYGPGVLGPKRKDGDCQAPEGFYLVGPRQMNPLSQFHLSFDLGYPNGYDRAQGATGYAIMVHGNCVSVGCYAMGDKAIEEIYALADAALREGQPSFHVHIFPFRMTDVNMRRHRESEWYPFWENLKEGYDHFEGGP